MKILPRVNDVRGAGLAGQAQRLKSETAMLDLDAQLVHEAPQIGRVECEVNLE